MRQAAIHRIIGQIYAAAGSPDRWEACLQSIRELFDATAAHLIHHNHRSHAGGVTAASGLDPAAMHDYMEYYHRVDPWALNVSLDIIDVGKVVLGQQLIPHSEIIKTEYYAGLGRPHDLTRAMT